MTLTTVPYVKNGVSKFLYALNGNQFLICSGLAAIRNENVIRVTAG